MTEASVTQELHKVLKYRLPGWDIYKCNDRVTKGRPDTTVTGAGYTSFLEMKLLKRGGSVEKCSDALQQVTMRKLYDLSGERAWYVLFDGRNPHAKRTIVCSPHALSRLNGADPPIYGGELDGRLCDVLGEHGCVSFDGFNYALVAEILYETHCHEAR
jgi:hypothetical protein